MTPFELYELILASPLRAYSRQELWHEYLSKIYPEDECLEFGVFTGKSINCMAAMRPRSSFHGFDSFEGLPEAWGRCGKGRFKCDVKKLKFQPNVKIHVGLFQQSLPDFLLQNNLSRLKAVHIDCDLGSSTQYVLNCLTSHLLEKKPLLLFDEFYNYAGYEKHEFGAFLEWANLNEVKFEILGRDVLHKQVLLALR